MPNERRAAPAGTARHRGRAPREPEHPPTTTHEDGWASRLRGSCGPLDYLGQQRGLSIATIESYRLGWGDSYWERCPTGFKFFVRNEAGEIVGFKERFWPEPWHLTGRRKQ